MELNTIDEIIDRLDALRAELNTYRPIPADRMNRIMQKLRLEWNFNSNSMEGNTLTKQETQKLLHYGITAKGKPLRDHIEMQGHDKALKKLEAIVQKDLKLSESLIKDFHKMILAESVSLLDENVEINPGEWKKHHNYLLSPTGERIDFAPPEQVPDLMSALMNWTNNHLYQADLNRHKKKKYDLHPLVVAAVFHKRFIAIHPFGDGNGRMGRILMNLILMQNGFMPTIVPLTSREGYYLALNDSTTEDMSPLIEYVGRNLIQSMELAIEGAKGNSVEEQDDWEKEVALLKQQLKEAQNPVLKMSADLVRDCILGSIEPLFHRFVEKMKVNFEDFFLEYEVFYGLNDIMYNNKEAFEEELIKNINPNNLKIQELSIYVRFNGFKLANKEDFSIYEELKVNFSRYNYEVIAGRREQKSKGPKRYSEEVSQEEGNTLIAQVGKEVTARIQQIIQRAK